MVESIRQAEMALGSERKVVDNVVLNQATQFERRLVASRDLHEGHVLTIDDLLFVRVSKNNDAIASQKTDAVICRQINKSISAGQAIKWQDLT